MEVDSFRNLMSYCNSRVPAVTGTTLHRDIHKLLYERLFKEISHRLQLHVSQGVRINLTIDAWTASNRLPFLAITAHWLTADFIQCNTLIGFERLRGSHTADNMVTAVMKVLKLYGIEDHSNCISSDNASVNDAIFNKLEYQLPSWSRRDGQIRCFAHVLNLAAQTVLVSLNSEAIDEEVVLASGTVSRDIDTSPAGALNKLWWIIAKIRCSTTLWVALKTEAEAFKVKWLSPILDVQVR